MKLKITNKWTAEVIELEGTSEELTAFMKDYKTNYNYYPWYVMQPSFSSSTPCIQHDFGIGLTNCQKCGAPNIFISPHITWSNDLTASGTTAIIAQNNSLQESVN